MGWLDGITYSMETNMSKFQEEVMDREVCPSAIHGGLKESDMTEQLNNCNIYCVPVKCKALCLIRQIISYYI